MFRYFSLSVNCLSISNISITVNIRIIEFAFDVTAPMLYKCVTVLLHTDWCIAITFCTFLLFYVFLLFYGLMPEIKMD